MQMEQTSRVKPLLVLNEVVEKRYADLADHGARVARYSESTARELGLPGAAVERLGLAGRLHDVGQGGRVEHGAREARRARQGRVGRGAQAP